MHYAEIITERKKEKRKNKRIFDNTKMVTVNPLAIGLLGSPKKFYQQRPENRKYYS